jgi:hypothetical protein
MHKCWRCDSVDLLYYSTIQQRYHSNFLNVTKNAMTKYY